MKNNSLPDDEVRLVIIKKVIHVVCFMLIGISSMHAQFVHPGISHKKSDLERMKSMVEAGKDPWISTYHLMQESSLASYDYNINGDPSITTLTSYTGFINDGFAAYYNALMWYITEDERHAQKCVEIFNSWVNITRLEDNLPLNAGRGVWKMMEAAEIIKSTYSGWNSSDIDKFKAMLVYPGFSGTTAPTDAIASRDVSFYWYIYNGDPARHGNQGLFAFRSVMAMGIFLDNEIIYNRALRYLQGLPHAANDLPYPSGPPILEPLTTGNEYYDEFRQVSRSDEIEDYGYNELISNYIWENGQGQESSRDQAHALGGISIITAMCEMAWSQGDDLYGHLDNRPLLGLEYYFRYNLSYDNSYPDQLTPWEPTVESGEYIQRSDRTGRWFSLKINPYNGNNLTEDYWTRGRHNLNGIYEMNLGHYKYRMQLDESKTKWLERGFQLLTETIGVENDDNPVDHPGWGGIKFRRVSPGDPISGFDAAGLPAYNMNKLPMTIEAENYDYFVLDGEGRTYHDLSASNTGGSYRTREGEAVDINTNTDGGHYVEEIETEEWLTYTVDVPIDGTYNIAIRYGAANANGTIKFSFDNTDVTGDVVVPFGANSTGYDDWQTFVVATDVSLTQGVQPMKISFNGESNAFNLDNIIITQESIACREEATPTMGLVEGIKYDYYQGTWSSLPDFRYIRPVMSEVVQEIGLSSVPSSGTDNFALDFHGFFDVPGDDYTFYLTSDNEARLLIDGVEIINNDGTNGTVEISRVLCLDEGMHEIQLEYFGTPGTGELSLAYESATISKTQISDLYGAPANIALQGTASQSSTDFDGHPELAIDGDTNGFYSNDSVTHTTIEEDPWWQVDFGEDRPIEIITIYGRLDGCCVDALSDFTILVIDNTGATTFSQSFTSPPYPYIHLETEGVQGSIVKVQAHGTTSLSLAEVEIYSEDSMIKQEQEITFNELPAKEIGDGSFSPGATTNSGLGITYSSSDPMVAEIINGNIHLVSSGTTVITASQSGNIDYSAAEEVTQVLTVGLGCDDTFDAFSSIEAEHYCDQFGTEKEISQDGTLNITNIDNGDWIKFDSVDFGEGVNKMFARVAGTSSGTIEIRQDEPAGALLGTVDVTSTGGDQIWETQQGSFEVFSGIKDIYLVFTGETDTLFNLNWIQFVETKEIPGLLEAEDYVEQFGIQLQGTNDDGGGDHVAFIQDGDYIAFDTDVLESGEYIVGLRVATGSAGGSIVLRSDDEFIEEVVIAPTGSWTTWNTVSSLVTLTEGSQRLKVEFVGGEGYLFNINWIEFKKPASLPGRLEAEDYTNQFGVRIENSTDDADVDGGGQIGFIQNEDYVSFFVDVLESGVYDFSVRASSGGIGGTLVVKNEEGILGEIEIPVTGGWTDWTTINSQITLEEGGQTLTFECIGDDGYLFNLNWFDFIEPAPSLTLMSKTSGSAADRMVRTTFDIANMGEDTVELDDITLRYWFTVEDYAPLNFYCDYFKAGSDKVIGTFEASTPARVGGYHYVDISFEDGIEIQPNTSTGEIITRISKSDWSVFNEEDDYSYLPSSELIENTTITMYNKGALFWGTEPTEAEVTTSLMAEYKTGDPQRPSDQEIKPYFQIRNTGVQPIPLSSISLKYWFTADGTEDIDFSILWSDMDGNVIEGNVSRLDSLAMGADRYLEVSFTSTDSLWSLSGTGEIKTRLTKTNRSPFSENNDYSYLEATDYVSNDKITMYVDDVLVWGIEPYDAEAPEIEEESLQKVALQSSDIVLYPNPMSTHITVQNHAGSRLEFYDSLGRFVTGYKIDNTTQLFDVSTLAKGLYFVKIINTETSIIQQIIKQ